LSKDCVRRFQKTKYKIDWVTKIGEGLSKEVYRADATLFEGKEEKHESFAISQLSYDAELEAGSRMIREQFILDSFNKKPASLSIPEPVGIIWHRGKLTAVTSFVYGIALELRASRSQVERPWEIIGKVAAEIHRLPIEDLPASLERYATRKEQAQSWANKFRKFDIPEIRGAVQWISENLPPEQGSVLIHGDLLGQNILCTLDQELFVIDWEYAFIGDPAYELAIVTRGVKRPFQVERGLERLLDSYLSSGGQEISKKDIYLYELLLCLGWYEQSLDRTKGGDGPDYFLDFLRRLLKKVK
jgi:aminoglycoside phosphotransferase